MLPSLSLNSVVEKTLDLIYKCLPVRSDTD